MLVNPVAFGVSSLMLSFFLIGDVVTFLKGWIGFFAFLVGAFLALPLAPTFFIFPWFDAWISQEPVNPFVMRIWLIWIASIAVSGVTSLALGRPPKPE